MARAIGLRASSGEVYYAVVEGTSAQPTVIAHDRLRTPKAFGVPETLSSFRTRVLLVGQEYEVLACGVRTTEPLAALKGRGGGKSSELRHYIEGVLLEATSSTGLRTIHGPSATLTARLDAGSSVKGYVQAADFRGVPGWANLKDEAKEAIIAAAAALSLLEVG